MYGLLTMSLAKTHQKYWEDRLKRRSFTRANGEKYVSSEYSVRISVCGKAEWFNLESANKTTAASKARDIWLFSRSHTRDEVLAEFKQKSPIQTTGIQHPTVGDLIREIGDLNLIKPKTLEIYSRKFRAVAAEATGLTRKKHHDIPRKRQKAWRKRVDSIKLENLTASKVIAWRAKRLKKASDPSARQAAIVTTTSLLRNAKALLSPKYTKHLSFPPPSDPFEGVPIGTSTTRKYRAEIDFKDLAQKARKELYVAIPRCLNEKPINRRRKQSEAESKNQQFKMLLLSLGCGLRRGEIDALLWKNLDFKENTISVLTTEFGSAKSTSSERTVDVAPKVMEIFKEYRETEVGEFVIISQSTPRPNAAYYHYRCNKHFRKLLAWLRKQGITRRNALHELRKEYGSRICQEFGIYAASTALGHGNIATTAASYLDKKGKVFVEL
ncbi:MAG: tyrosine-type recombinase/integrase [Flavobacteriaceae bacterium]